MGFLRMRPYGGREYKHTNNDAKNRELKESWEKLLIESAKPLEQGAKAKGVVVDGIVQVKKPVVTVLQKRIPSLPMGAGGTKPVVDPLGEAKDKLKSHIGMVYNKGGLQYLSDEDIAEQRSGTHKRR